MSKIKLIEVNSDLGGRYPGARIGPDAVRIASHFVQDGINLYSRFKDDLFTSIEVPSHLYHQGFNYAYAKRIEYIYPLFERICDSVSNSILNHDFTVVLSGDHISAGGTIAGIKHAIPKSRLGIVWIDAHSDVHNPYTSDTGNMHGMPLSTAINDDNIECKFNDICPETKE